MKNTHEKYSVVVEYSTDRLRIAVIKEGAEKIMASDIVLDLAHAFTGGGKRVALDPLVSEIIENRYHISLPLLREKILENNGIPSPIIFPEVPESPSWYIFNARNHVHTEIITPFHYEVVNGKGWDLFYFETFDEAISEAKGKAVITSSLSDLIKPHHLPDVWNSANQRIWEEARSEFPMFYKNLSKDRS